MQSPLGEHYSVTIYQDDACFSRDTQSEPSPTNSERFRHEHSHLLIGDDHLEEEDDDDNYDEEDRVSLREQDHDGRGEYRSSRNVEEANRKGRSLSWTTAIHLDEEHDFHEEEQYPSHASSEYAQQHDYPLAVPRDIEISDLYQSSFDTLESMKESHGQIKTISSSRTSPLRERERNLSSPTRDRLLSRPISRTSNRRACHTPTSQLLDSPHSRPAWTSQDRAAFRNASSVRAMQLSSPSPPPFYSPRSNREIRHGTPQGRTRSRSQIGSPTRHKNPNKEYPLILLHCSISPIPLPYSAEVLVSTLPNAVQESLALLQRKLGRTVLERGILVPHPGEDYELLEERILESLEMKQPRVTKCGHFLGDDVVGASCSTKTSSKSIGGHEDKRAGLDANGAAGSEEDYLAACTQPRCEDCGRVISIDVQTISCDRIPSGDAQVFYRRWDIRVYAANGLMRAGAWSAAWKEMEGVDVEIGIHMTEHVRRLLEDAAAKEEQELSVQPTSFKELAEEQPLPVVDRKRDHHSRHVSELDAPSTATCTWASSPGKVPQNRTTTRQNEQKLPLSVLLMNYVRRNLSPRPETMLQLLLLMLGIWYFMSRGIPTGFGMLSPHNVSAVTNKQPAAMKEAHVEELQWDFKTPLPACTFGLGQEGEGMLVLPTEVATQVLRALSKTTAMPSATELPSSAENPLLGQSAGTAGNEESGRNEDPSPAEESSVVQHIVGAVLAEG